MLLRTCSGAVCPAEALIGSHCRGNWVAAGRSVGLLIHDVKLLKAGNSVTQFRDSEETAWQLRTKPKVSHNQTPGARYSPDQKYVPPFRFCTWFWVDHLIRGGYREMVRVPDQDLRRCYFNEGVQLGRGRVYSKMPCQMAKIL